VFHSKQELLGQFSSTVEQNCIIKKDDLRAKNLCGGGGGGKTGFMYCVPQ
jgi:hypothetical protein